MYKEDEKGRTMKKVVLITGGTRGIGKATAKKFLKENYEVAIVSTGSNESLVKDLLDELSEEGTIKHYSADISKALDCEDVVKRVLEDFQQVDVLANVAGIVGEQKNLWELDNALIEKVIDTNVMGSIYLAKHLSAHMKERGSGTIVNVGSIDGIIANHENIAYHASKGAIRMFTQALGRELGPYGVRVVSVGPGWIRTEMLMDQVDKNGPEMLETGGQMHMKGRIIEPEEIADVIYLMTLPEASAINGTTVMADDGYSAFKGVKQPTQV